MDGNRESEPSRTPDVPEQSQSDLLSRKVARLENYIEELKSQYRALYDSVRPIAQVLAGRQDSLPDVRGASFRDLIIPTSHLRKVPLLQAAYQMLDKIQQNEGVDIALSNAVQTLLLEPNCKREARQLAFALMREGGQWPNRNLGFAVYLSHERQHRKAYHLFCTVPLDQVLRLAAVMFARSVYVSDPAEAHSIFANAKSIAILRSRPSTLVEIAGIAFTAGDHVVAKLLMDALRTEPKGRIELDRPATWIRDIIERHEGRRSSKAANYQGQFSRRVNLAVLDYKHCDVDRVSKDIGDFIQTLAFLSSIVRFETDLTTEEPGLAALLFALTKRLRPDRRVPSTLAASLVIVNRDQSHADAIPEPTWLFAYGWYMARPFEIGFDFPFHRNIRPIFISFHIHLPEMMTPEAIGYLKDHAPIGCRDWYTVYLLRGFGIECFFSGCLTTTLDSLFPIASPVDVPDRTAYVDFDFGDGGPERGSRMFAHEEERVKEASLAQNLGDALARLDAYRSGFTTIATSRLHCYLPCLAMGKRTVFKPYRPGDTRFEGLADLDRTSLKNMRNALLNKLKRMVEILSSGAPENVVYARWRAMCQDEVRSASAVCARITPIDWSDEVVRSFIAMARHRDHRSERLSQEQVSPVESCVEIAFAVDCDYLDVLATCLASILAHTSRRLRVWLLARRLTSEQASQLRHAFKSVIFEVIDCDAVDLFESSIRPAHVSVAAMDRLILCETIPVEKVVYLDVDTILLADVGEIYDCSMLEPIAARPRRNPNLQIHHDVEAACRRLAADLAADLRRRTLTIIPATRPVFNAGLMLLDLQRMRDDRFCNRFLPYADLFRMNDQEILNLYAQGRWDLLPEGWNVIPGFQPVDCPKMLHWAGPDKPWQAGYVPMKEVWSRFQRTLAGQPYESASSSPMPSA